ncbi:protein MIZU-KUSSEI 1 [Rhodamnia argentea]|uniref:Protein MIZU-KUSSEI 1 n=1 Tax=Rhodamnia argentea TaxID=178133 RepID=A0ABM3GRV7_9MYRT|nr:protein MIZU-KUSSEI 1 [Rhodamnia argentea]
MRSQELALQRTTTTTTTGSYRSARRITPSSTFPRPRTPPSPPPPPSLSHHEDMAASAASDNKLLLRKSSSRSSAATHHRSVRISSLLRSFLSLISSFQLQNLIPAPAAACRFLSFPRHLSLSSSSSSSSLGRKVTGTLFGHRRGHVSFAVQDGPQSDPVLLLELAISTSALVKEMSSGLVRIALECEKIAADRPPRLFQEPAWTMYCNGRKCGYAASRSCTESDLHVLRTVRTMSVGAGVIPVLADDGRKSGGGDGELLYMRARFERVVGSRDSEAFYMLNPDGNGGPELSIFLLRI